MTNTKDKEAASKAYGSESIKVLEGLEGAQDYDISEISNKIKKRGDILIVSKELKIKYRALKSALYKARIFKLLPNIQKSKASILAWLRTNREVLLFAEKHKIHLISARELVKLVRKWNEDVQHSPRMFLSEYEHDLIIGSLLGDASVRQRDRNCCFRVSHSVKQREYIEWKLNQLRLLEICEFAEKKRKIGEHEVHIINLSTKTHPALNYYRTLFYKEGRKVISNEILNQLNPRSIAVWICDDGSYSNKQGNITLCTNAYSLEEHHLMKEFFKERFGLDPTIGFRDGKYYYLRFKKEDSKKLINLVEPFIPVCMLYKIGGRRE